MLRGAYYRVVGSLFAALGGSCPDALTAVLSAARMAGDAFSPSGRREAYLGHLRRAFPGRPAYWYRGVLRRFWTVHQRAFLGLFAASRLDSRTLAEKVSWRGREHLDRALDEGRGVLLLAPHFGDERTMHIAMSLAGYDMHVLSTGYEGAPEAVRRARLSTSLETHHVAFPGDNPRWMYRALESGSVVQLAPTGYGGPGGFWTRSFGVPVLAPSTPFRLREATGCAVLLAANHALAGLRCCIRILPVDLDGDTEMAARRLFGMITRLGLEWPGQYNWMNLAIRHRETNTMARLGRIPADEHDLEREAVRADGDPGSVSDPRVLPPARFSAF